MANSRTARVPTNRVRYVKSDSGEETERESAPKATKPSSMRRRRSEVLDKSNHEDGGLSRTETVNLNDDAAEKRRRRQSNRTGGAEPSGTGAPEDVDENGPRNASGRPLQQLQSVVEPTPVIPSMDNFEEWMKMAMDGVRILILN
jgi:condensin complex subunit 2